MKLSYLELQLKNLKQHIKIKTHINELYRKASEKFQVLQRIRRCLSADKTRLLANAFIDSQFNIIMDVWCKTIHKICKFYHRTLKKVWAQKFQIILINIMMNCLNRIIICLFIRNIFVIEVFKSIMHLYL